MYRFLLTPRWLGLGLLMVLASATMVGLGAWQWDRYQYRSDLNARIDAATQAPPQQLTEVLGVPPEDAGVGPAPQPEDTWRMVTVTGRFDPAHEILARARTVNRTVGFEVITPLVLPDGSAVLVDRGWIPAPAGAAAAPVVPAAPSGDVVVVGRVHAPESRAAAPEEFDGRLAVRRIDPAKIADVMPYPIYGAYLTLESQTPPADPAFVTIPPDHENAALNAGYTVQWWAFAALTLVGYGYLAYRHAHPTRADQTEAGTA